MLTHPLARGLLLALALTLTACAGPHHRQERGAERPAAGERLDQQADEAQRELEEAVE